MILKVLKQVNNLTEKDVILSSISHLLKQPSKVNDKIIEVLKKSKVNYVQTLLETGDEPLNETLNKINEQRLDDELMNLREDLIEELKDVFKPWSEEDKIFNMKNKKNFLKLNDLTKKELENVYWGEILEGSHSILPKHKITAIQKILYEIYKYFDIKKSRIKENLYDKNVIKKLYLYSVRRTYNISNDESKNEGDSILLHAVDTTIYFLITIANLNKSRLVNNAPRSTTKFYIDKTDYDEFTEFYYVEDIIIDAALGSILHPIGLMHKTMLKELQTKISVREDFKNKHEKKIETLELNINIARNLFRNREDISSVSKMIINFQKDFLDITGYPDPKTNKFTHELIRIFHIIDIYDELTNPIIVKEPANPMEAIYFIAKNSGQYFWNKKKSNEYSYNRKFDVEMLKNFLVVLAPFDYGQVLVINKINTNETLFNVAVFTYKLDIKPILTVLNHKNISYKIGDILIDLEANKILIKGNDSEYNATSLKNMENFYIKNIKIDELNRNEIKLVLFNKERKYKATNINEY